MKAQGTVSEVPGRTAARREVVFCQDGAREVVFKNLELLCDPARYEGEMFKKVQSSSSRTVWRCLIDGQGYFLKHFHTNSFWHKLGSLIRGDDARRELVISQLLAAAKVRTVEVVAVGRTGKRSWILSREIAPVLPLNVWHDRLSSQGRGAGKLARRVGKCLAAELARMHAAGLFHGDLHTGNVLLKDYTGACEPVILDLHRIRRRRPTSRQRAIDLAMLMYDRMHITTLGQRLAFLRDYLAAAKCGGTLVRWATRVWVHEKRRRRSQLLSRDRQIGRSGNFFARLRLGKGWRAWVVLACRRPSASTVLAGKSIQSGQWRQLLHDLLKQKGADKAASAHSPTCQVESWTVEVNSLQLRMRIKRWGGGGLLAAIGRKFRPDNARRLFHMGHALVTRRIPTPLPLAALEKRRFGLVLEEILITEALPQAVSLEEFARQSAPQAAPETAARMKVLAEKLLLSLHQDGFSLGAADPRFRLDDLLVETDPAGQPRAVLGDLEAVKWPLFLLWGRKLKERQNLKKLLFQM